MASTPSLCSATCSPAGPGCRPRRPAHNGAARPTRTTPARVHQPSWTTRPAAIVLPSPASQRPGPEWLQQDTSSGDRSESPATSERWHERPFKNSGFRKSHVSQFGYGRAQGCRRRAPRAAEYKVSGSPHFRWITRGSTGTPATPAEPEDHEHRDRDQKPREKEAVACSEDQIRNRDNHEKGDHSHDHPQTKSAPTSLLRPI